MRKLSRMAPASFMIAVICSATIAMAAPSTAKIRYNALLVRVTPRTTLADEPMHISVVGVAPNRNVTLQLETWDADGQAWRSWARFQATRNGTVDLDRAAPIAGTYRGVDGMGLFWSMQQSSGRPAFFYFPRSSAAQYSVTASSGGRAYSASFFRVLMSGVGATDLNGPVFGRAFEPQTAKVRAGVVFVGGSGGGHPWDADSALLASRGYETVSLDYYDYHDPKPGLPRQLVSIPVESVLNAITWMKNRPGMSGKPFVVIGHSRGSELALLAAVQSPDIRGAVGLSPSPIVWPGLPYPFTGKDVTAWTLGGSAVPFAPSEGFWERGQAAHQGQLQIFATAFESALKSNCGCSIDIWNIRGPTLMLYGRDDQVWPASLFVQTIEDELRAHGRSFQDRAIGYADAGHFMFEPYVPQQHRITINYPSGPVNFGGTAAGDARAAVGAWQEILRFLASVR
ncbi:MAG: alpha/beta fold hydrolase [Acidobacteriaceae bacterium]|nr:alpha/beta fold hydrolase [Acidobacteriaceae bacterium]